MSENGKEKLLSLLFNDERELVNLRFFPGINRGLTADEMCEEAHFSLAAALSRGAVDQPPLSGRVAAALE